MRDDDLKYSAVYTVLPCFIDSLPGHSNRSPPRLPLHMNAAEIIPTISMSNIYIGLCLHKAVTEAQLRSYELFRNIKSVGFWGILSFPLLRDEIPHRLARGIPLNQEVP
jgi:hypothetical protein